MVAILLSNSWQEAAREHHPGRVQSGPAVHQATQVDLPSIRHPLADDPVSAAHSGPGNPSIDSPASRVLVGRVVNSEGRPISTATVAVFGVIGDRVSLRADAATDDDGMYRCRLEFAATGIEIVVVASCVGYQPDKKTVVLGASTIQELDWQLHPGNGVFGRVLSGGRSVVGAFVTVVGRSADGSIRTAFDRILADGRFAVGFHSTVRAEQVVVFHGQLGVAVRPCLDHPFGGDLGVMELVPRDPLAAQLVNRAGQPLAGLHVSIIRTVGNDLDGGVGGCFWDPVTDSSGSFILHGMRAGTFNVFVGGTELSGFSNPVGKIETGGAPKIITIAGARVRVRALLGEADYPPADMWVSWYRQSGGSWKSDRSTTSYMDRLVEADSVWRLDLVRRRDEAVVASQQIHIGAQDSFEVTLRAVPE
ncbi:MAG: carboxypeptidase-like regulatory domain-containing protein [Planctomycetes bacterium]|nr:carboxypeptidase-like regulatory domain-containing protein [Planctomycetota bacterium]